MAYGYPTNTIQGSGAVLSDAAYKTAVNGPTLPIPAELEQLDEAIARLNSIADGMAFRLSSVIPLTDRPIDGAEAVRGAVGSSELAQRIYRARINVNHIADLIADLGQRAEL